MVRRIGLHGLFDRPRWKGPVERRDPEAVRGQSVIVTWRCSCCGEFAPEGSRKAERCLVCHSPMPQHAREGRPFPSSLGGT